MSYPRYSLLLSLCLAFCALTAQERFSRWHTDIRLNRDRSVEVVETITVVAEGEEVQRGITRSLVNRGEQRTRILSVERDDRVTPYHTESGGSGPTIYIGSRDVLLKPGTYTYRIAYTLEGAVVAEEGLDELDFNVFGGVNFPVEEVRVTVAYPDGALPFQQACYTGRRGAKERNCTSTRPENGALIFRSTGPVPTGEPLTVAVGFRPGYFTFREPEVPPAFPLRYGSLIVLLLTGVVAWRYAYGSWRAYGVDPPSPDIPPTPYPPAGHSPASMALLASGFGHSGTGIFTASLMDLARKGYLRITSEPGVLTSSDYRLEKVADHPPAEELPTEQLEIFERLFKRSDTVILSGRHNSRIERVSHHHYQSVYRQHKDFLYQGHNLGRVLPLLGILIVGGLMALALTQYDRSGYAQIALIVFVVLAVIGAVVYATVIGQPSVEKVRLRAEIGAFRDYLDLPEARRAELPDAPEMNPEYYERLLPYAIAFGIHTKWTDYFQGITEYQEYQPNYLVGPSVQINQFQRSFHKSVSATATAPASSSSGSSSSGGGGSSGGGSSGGGGAGGW